MIRWLLSAIIGKGPKRVGCPITCHHCEVDISERTAFAIRKLLTQEIGVLGKAGLYNEQRALLSFRQKIVNGDWHNEYDQIVDGIETRRMNYG